MVCRLQGRGRFQGALAFQTVIGATAICAVLEKLTGTSFSLILVSVLFGIVQAVVAIVGDDFAEGAIAGRFTGQAGDVRLSVRIARQSDRPQFCAECGIVVSRQERLELGDLRCLVQCGGRRLADDDHQLGRFLPLFA